MIYHKWKLIHILVRVKEADKSWKKVCKFPPIPPSCWPSTYTIKCAYSVEGGKVLGALCTSNIPDMGLNFKRVRAPQNS